MSKEPEQTAIPGTERSRGRIVADSELKAMTDFCRTLEALPDDSKGRVLRYLSERFQGVDVVARVATLERRLDNLEQQRGER